MQPSQATANPVGEKACSSTKAALLRYIPNTYSIHKVLSLKFAYFQGRLSRHMTSPSEKTRPESWPEDYMGKQLRSGSCNYPTAATKCNVQPNQATANPVGGNQGWFTALYTQHLLDSQIFEFEICIFPREAIPSQLYA